MLRFNIFKIVGDSMSPTLQNGSFVVCFATKYTHYSIGDIVVVRHKTLQMIVKRIVAIDASGRMKLGGDNVLSISSDKMGWIKPVELFGKVRAVVA